MKDDPLRYLVVLGTGAVLGTYPSKSEVKRVLAQVNPDAASVAERQPDSTYRMVAKYSARDYADTPFVF